MWKTRVIIGLIILLFLSQPSLASQSYLPKADLIKGTGPEVYILENSVKYWIPNPEIFEYFRYKWTNIKNISDALLDSYPQGNDLSRYDDYPEGSLLRGAGPEVYLIELGQRRWIPNPAIFEASDFGWKYILDIDDDKLKRISQGDNLTLSEPNRYPETIILEGPEQGEVLETSEITFRFSGTNPLGLARDLEFETFLRGYDKDWRHQYSGDTKTYNLKENKVYTFYVRAKNEQGYLDPSPAKHSFQIGLSPYYQKIEIRNVHTKEDNFTNDYFKLRNNKDELINLTNWTIETSKKEIITIPQAVERLTYPFSKNNYSDIKLAYGDEIVISMGLAPDGVNFQINQCTGYLDQLSQYHPSLDEDCPYLSESKYSHLEKTCCDFIDDLNRCELPNYTDEPAINKDSQCTNFLTEKFNYQQCYLDHYREVDFFEGEWLVFLNKSFDILDNDNETLILRDKSGLLVDQYDL